MSRNGQGCFETPCTSSYSPKKIQSKQSPKTKTTTSEKKKGKSEIPKPVSKSRKMTLMPMQNPKQNRKSTRKFKFAHHLEFTEFTQGATVLTFQFSAYKTHTKCIQNSASHRNVLKIINATFYSRNL